MPWRSTMLIRVLLHWSTVSPNGRANVGGVSGLCVLVFRGMLVSLERGPLRWLLTLVTLPNVSKLRRVVHVTFVMTTVSTNSERTS